MYTFIHKKTSVILLTHNIYLLFQNREGALSPLIHLSYKRARGPMGQVGPPIVQFSDPQPVTCKGETWHRDPPAGVPDIIDHDSMPPGRPSGRVEHCLTESDIFLSFVSEELLEPVVRYTNMKAAQLRESVGPTNQNSFTFADTTLLELKAFIGCIILAG